MNQRLAIITLGVTDIERSKHFYMNGFGWNPILESKDTALYQMNGFVLSTWLKSELEQDIMQFGLNGSSVITLAHNVTSEQEVQPFIDHLVCYGGSILRNAAAPSHGGLRGYITDPDNHIWEIIWNPVLNIGDRDWVTYSSTSN